MVPIWELERSFSIYVTERDAKHTTRYRDALPNPLGREYARRTPGGGTGASRAPEQEDDVKRVYIRTLHYNPGAWRKITGPETIGSRATKLGCGCS
jgi:hypothetical protein